MLSRLFAKLVPPAPGPLEPEESLAVFVLGEDEDRDDVNYRFDRFPEDLTGRRVVVRVEDREIYAHGAAADELVRFFLVERGADAIFVVGDDLRTVRDLRAALARRGLDRRRVVRRDAAELLDDV